MRGGGGVVLFDAPAGLGKTALLEEGAAMAGAAGWLVRRATPSPLECGLPFGVLRALLEAPTRELPGVATGAATAAGELLLGGVAAARRRADDGAQRAVAVLRAGGVDGRSPWWWMTRSRRTTSPSACSRTWRGGVEDLPLLVLVGTRSSCDLLSLVGSVRAAAVLHPEPLFAAGAARLVRRVAPDAGGTVCRDLHRAAGGVPWLLTELARGGAVRGGARLVRRRLAEASRAGAP